MIEVPESYFISKFNTYVGSPTMSSNGNMIGCCPYCKEGSSWGKKKRFVYYSDKEFMMCFNCDVTVDKFNFIKQMEGISFTELMDEIRENGGGDIENKSFKHLNYQQIEEKNKITLPEDSIDLFDETQTNFFKDEYFVNLALKTIRDRRLDTSRFRGELYLSRTHFVHKNRIIIPFRGNGDMEFYQSRSQTKNQEDMGKYLSCLNGDKTFYGIDKLNRSLEYIFVLEGPLDCFFVENSIGGGGTKLNQRQQNILEDFQGLNTLVYCLDNDFDNKDVVKHYLKHIKNGERVFMWGGEFEKYGDFNDYCVGEEVDSVDITKILEHTYSGKDASKELIKKLG